MLIKNGGRTLSRFINGLGLFLLLGACGKNAGNAEKTSLKTTRAAPLKKKENPKTSSPAKSSKALEQSGALKRASKGTNNRQFSKSKSNGTKQAKLNRETDKPPVATLNKKELRLEQMRQLVGDWQCVTKQPMMEVRTEESFSADQRATSEGGITFSMPNGPTLNIHLKGRSRWRLTQSAQTSQDLCEVPLELDFTQVSGEANIHVDQLLKSMRDQTQARVDGNLETCRSIVSLTNNELILKTPQKEVETRCMRKDD